MDLREYEYITRRPDTFPISTLKSIRGVLSKTQSDCASLIDKILHDGYVKPPSDYKWHGCYQIVLSEKEKMAVQAELRKAENILGNDLSLTGDERNYLRQYASYWSRMITDVPETYEEYKSKQTYYDLRNVSFDKFINFVFEHDVAGIRTEPGPWYFRENIWIDWNKEHVSNLFIELFHRADELLAIFPKDKLEQGFWAVMSQNLECNAYHLIHDEELDVNLKEKLVCSMYFLYENLFAKDPLETSSNMWWDSLAFDFRDGGPRDPANNNEDKRIQNAMFSTLIKILSIKSEACQGAALHGLGHLRHPKTAGVINDFIRRNKHLTDEQVAYAKACITGEIM